LNVEIIRKTKKPICLFPEHFRNFEKVKAIQKIFGDTAPEVLANLEIEFTNSTIYMRVDYDGRLLINPKYFERGDFTDLYLDVIHELVHVKQVLNGKNCNHALPYVQRPLEIEAYKTAVDEARALGLDGCQIVEYLDSDLINAEELQQLTTTLEINCEKRAINEEND
jgi:hypothetical protein